MVACIVDISSIPFLLTRWCHKYKQIIFFDKNLLSDNPYPFLMKKGKIERKNFFNYKKTCRTETRRIAMWHVFHNIGWCLILMSALKLEENKVINDILYSQKINVLYYNHNSPNSPSCTSVHNTKPEAIHLVISNFFSHDFLSTEAAKKL